MTYFWTIVDVNKVKTMEGLCCECDDLPANLDATLSKAAAFGHAECVGALIQARS